MRSNDLWLVSAGLERDMGGIASVTRCCLMSLCQDKKRLKVISLRGDGSFLRDYRRQTSADFRFRCCRGSAPKVLWQVFLQIAEKPSLILFDHVDLSQCQALVPRPFRRPHFTWIYGIDAWRPLPHLKKLGLRSAKKVFSISDFTTARARQFHPWLRPPTTIHLGVEPRENGDISAPMGEQRHKILTVGRLEKGRPKGHRQILAALPRVAERVTNIEWHVVGDGSWTRSFEALVKSSKMSHRVFLHGFVDDVELDRLYRSCHVFCMPSFGEGFGLVYIEAMARGLLCIGSNRDAASEIIGDAGLCVDPDKPEDLSNAICRVLLDDEYYSSTRPKIELRNNYFGFSAFSNRFLAAISE